MLLDTGSGIDGRAAHSASGTPMKFVSRDGVYEGDHGTEPAAKQSDSEKRLR